MFSRQPRTPCSFRTDKPQPSVGKERSPAARAQPRADKPQPPAPSPQPCHDTHIRRTADVPTARVEWLWPGRIPIGKVTLLVGDPGLGKSLLALDIAARVSTGSPWPDEERATRSEDRDHAAIQALAPRSSILASSSVLLLNSEDDLADTIRPRLEAHGADCNRVFHVESVTDLRHDFEELRAAIDRTPECRLIIVDPVNAFVGPNDSHFHTVVRKVLAPLAKLATQKRLAVLAVTHLRKHEGAAIHRAAGSMGFVAAARAVWTVCRDPSDPNRNLFVPLKNNLAATATILAYSIQPHPEFDAPVIRWHHDTIPISAEEAFTHPPKPRGPEAAEQIAAARWLRQALAKGPIIASEIINEGQDLGFRPRTLQRTFHAMGGKTVKSGPYGGWSWSLTTATQNDDQADPGKLGALERTWRLAENSTIPI